MSEADMAREFCAPGEEIHWINQRSKQHDEHEAATAEPDEHVECAHPHFEPVYSAHSVCVGQTQKAQNDALGMHAQRDREKHENSQQQEEQREQDVDDGQRHPLRLVQDAVLAGRIHVRANAARAVVRVLQPK